MMPPPPEKSSEQGNQRAGASTNTGYDNKTTLPPLGTSIKTDQPDLYNQAPPSQPYEYNVQPNMYTSYQQTNYDPYQRQNFMQQQNAYTGVTPYVQSTSYTQPTSYTSSNAHAPNAIRFSYSGGVSAVPTSSSKTENQQQQGSQEKKNRRFRRRYNQIVRKYPCSFPGCSKSYGSLNHLNTHIVSKKHGPRKSKLDFQNGTHKKEDKMEPGTLQTDHTPSAHVPQLGVYQIPQQSQIPAPPQHYVTPQPNEYSGYYYGYSAPPNIRPTVSNDSVPVPSSGTGLYYSGLPTTSAPAPQQAVSQIQSQRTGGSTAAPQYYSVSPQQSFYTTQFQQQQTPGTGLYSNQPQSSPQQRTNQH
ncbi:hypothetical protein KGF57_000046 [Candida theae]|uniref:C2H2-type domain-containing protein n=1 Tax=Candida theae TaxID=1198502 RepID=A0AAD5BJS5_9ASCO|nr:uncharacterized protein KGF57_000046 [Candida theae]KAI5968931.1 hypothetical protein KGF57_000046 [Candida theae]